MDWLGKAESYLTEDQPVLGDLDTVSLLLEQHRVGDVFHFFPLIVMRKSKSRFV